MDACWGDIAISIMLLCTNPTYAARLINDITFRSSLGENARKLYEREYTPEKNYSQLIGLYEELVNGANVEAKI